MVKNINDLLRFAASGADILLGAHKPIIRFNNGNGIDSIDERIVNQAIENGDLVPDKNNPVFLVLGKKAA